MRTVYPVIPRIGAWAASPGPNRIRYRDASVLQKCGHPLAARMVVPTVGGRLVTDCWACKVEREIKP